MLAEGMVGRLRAALRGRMRPLATRPVATRPVATWVDAAYGPATCVMLESLYRNNLFTAFDTYIFTPAGDEGVARQPFTDAFATLRRRFGRRIVVRTADDAALARLPLSTTLPYLNRATYGNLLLVDLVPAGDFLYLDSDIVVQADIGPLLRLDLGTHLIAAAFDYGEAAAWGERLGIAEADAYVNNGVMLVNARLWRREQVMARLWQWLERLGERATFVDQDLLNAATIGRKRLLEQNWNTQQHALLAQKRVDEFDADGFVGIFHFTWIPKPWSPDAIEATRKLYERYAATAPLRM